MAYYNNTSSTPCKYFQQGRCNRGSSCKFAHVYIGSNANGQRQTNEESMSEADLYKSFINTNSLPRIEKALLSGLKEAETFQMRPLSSAYSYGSPCAVNLISGRDYSQEESRFQFYESKKNSAVNRYELEMTSRENDMLKCFAHIRSHPDWAARFLQKNTKDLVETGQITMKNDFVNFPLDLGGANSQSNTSTFGANPFTSGKPAFGAALPTAPGGPFGIPMNGSLGAFGQPSMESNKGSAAFGGSRMGGNASGAGSAFGAPAFGGNAISAGQNTGASVFGKPAFGAGAATSAFSAATASNPTSNNTFGNSMPAQSSIGSGSVFGKPQFGSAAPSTQMNSTGAANTAFGTPAFGSPAFGSQTNPGFSSTINSSATTAPTPFGSTAFGSAAFGSTGFGGNKNAAGSSPFSSLQSGKNTGSTGQTASPFSSLQNNQSSTSTNPPFASFQNQPSAVSPFGTNQSGINSADAGQNNASNVPNSSPFGSLNQKGPLGPSSPFGNLQGNKNSNSLGSNPSPFASASQISFSKPNASPFGAFSDLKETVTATRVSAPHQRFVQGLPSEDDKLAATDLDKFTLEQFESTHFTLGKVPDMPPPLALIGGM